MTGAMYAAISGMKTHMNKLNVIGNNVANVNTFGYKTARTTFQESIYTSVRNGSNGSNTAGGMNPSQLGYGCNIGTIDLDMGTGQYVPTGVNSDCMISGDGFFFVGPKPELAANGTMPLTNAKDLNLTRVGNFKFDADGYLVDGNGSVVFGFVSCASGAPAVPPALPTKPGDPGTANPDNPLFSTQLVPIRLPLAATGDPADPAALPVAGTPIYPGVDGSGQNIYATDPADTTGKTVAINLESINIDGKTGMISASANPGGNIVVGYIPMAKVANPSGLTHIQGPYYQALAGAGDCTVASLGNVTDGVGLNNGIAPAGGGAVTPIFGSGTTEILAGALEGSSTDIATEFAEMISTQRGYQANTRIITVTDSMLEELVNIKR